MKHDQIYNWLNGFLRFGVKLDLNRIRFLCEKLKNPQNNYKTIHVGGTNGKGSISKYLGSILKESGYKTGVYTSPHLEHFNERITIDNLEISDEDLSLSIDKIKPIVEEMMENDMNPTYFEIITSLAFYYFSLKNIDIAIIEVGLGGRFDATNIIKPEISIISNISLEHTDRLGKTIEEISFEKAGIIKENIPTITSAKEKSLDIIKKQADKKDSQIIILSNENWKRTGLKDNNQTFEISIFDKNYFIKTNLLGKFQGENIAVSIATCVKLKQIGFKIHDKNIVDGIKNTKNPGRMELISNRPMILLDGAHNLNAIKELKKSLKNDFIFNRLILVIGILKDKNFIEMIEEIVPIADIIVTTKSKNPRSISPYSLKKEIEYIDYKKSVFVMDNIEKAVLFSKQNAGINDMICFCGSLFIIGEVRAFFKQISLF